MRNVKTVCVRFVNMSRYMTRHSIKLDQFLTWLVQP